MNLKWFQDRLTFVIIPAADRGAVRFRLSRGAVCGILLTALVGLGCAAGLVIHHVSSAASVFRYTTELNGRAANLEEDLLRKSRRIEELQQEVISLSRQAAEVRSRIEAVKKLEHELRQMEPGTGELDGEEQASGAFPPSVLPVFLGQESRVTPAGPENAFRLAAAASGSLTWLRREMGSLAEELDDARRRLLLRQERLQHTPSLWPTVSRVVTSAYGPRKDPFTKKNSFHRGIDIAGKLDDPVFAAASGTVQEVGYDNLHGHYVIVEHSGDLRTWYMHLNSASVSRGQLIAKGEPIGRLGTTGRSTGPHLHYEVQLQGKSTDPRRYLDAGRPFKQAASPS
ncbi:peptidoglycan DD-metalloendopeptidase family protein [Paenibacillus filicis]|uniref:Peptidoglycan DD-metalloendopeptidase family protein n=1 Tax=Paenibacillus filicis TaxID=669464 RepID=A0ABU9DGV8_9BACL